MATGGQTEDEAWQSEEDDVDTPKESDDADTSNNGKGDQGERLRRVTITVPRHYRGTYTAMDDAAIVLRAAKQRYEQAKLFAAEKLNQVKEAVAELEALQISDYGEERAKAAVEWEKILEAKKELEECADAGLEKVVEMEKGLVAEHKEQQALRTFRLTGRFPEEIEQERRFRESLRQQQESEPESGSDVNDTAGEKSLQQEPESDNKVKDAAGEKAEEAQGIAMDAVRSVSDQIGEPKEGAANESLEEARWSAAQKAGRITGESSDSANKDELPPAAELDGETPGGVPEQSTDEISPKFEPEKQKIKEEEASEGMATGDASSDKEILEAVAQAAAD